MIILAKSAITLVGLVTSLGLLSLIGCAIPPNRPATNAPPSTTDVKSRNDSAPSCDVTVSEIAVGVKAVPTGGSTKLSVTVDNPTGRLINYNWQVLFGVIYPSVGAIASQTTYTAPNVPTNEVVKLSINIEGCQPLARTVQILVVAAQSSAFPALPMTSFIAKAHSQMFTVATPNARSQTRRKVRQGQRLVIEQRRREIAHWSASSVVRY